MSVVMEYGEFGSDRIRERTGFGKSQSNLFGTVCFEIITVLLTSLAILATYSAIQLAAVKSHLNHFFKDGTNNCDFSQTVDPPCGQVDRSYEIAYGYDCTSCVIMLKKISMVSILDWTRKQYSINMILN